jgi:hypothetical protein
LLQIKTCALALAILFEEAGHRGRPSAPAHVGAVQAATQEEHR